MTDEQARDFLIGRTERGDLAEQNAAPQERPLNTNGGQQTGHIKSESECLAARGEAPRVPAGAAPEGPSGGTQRTDELRLSIDVIHSLSREEMAAWGARYCKLAGQLERELAAAREEADRFFQLSGCYLERANKAEAELAADKDVYKPPAWEETDEEFAEQIAAFNREGKPNPEDARDAARWRWLRKYGHTLNSGSLEVEFWDDRMKRTIEDGDELDAAIDAAMGDMSPKG